MTGEGEDGKQLPAVAQGLSWAPARSESARSRGWLGKGLFCPPGACQPAARGAPMDVFCRPLAGCALGLYLRIVTSVGRAGTGVLPAAPARGVLRDRGTDGRTEGWWVYPDVREKSPRLHLEVQSHVWAQKCLCRRGNLDRSAGIPRDLCLLSFAPKS